MRAETGALLPMAEWSAAITHARANQAVVGVLLERVRDPSGGATDREDCRRHRTGKAEHANAYGEVEVEVGAQAFAFRYGSFHFGCSLEKVAAPALGDPLRYLP